MLTLKLPYLYITNSLYGYLMYIFSFFYELSLRVNILFVLT